MRKSPPKRSNLFLLELILAIFFFALASAVCIRLFVQARTLTLESHKQNQALTCAKNLSALFESRKGSLPDMAEDFPLSTLEDSRLEIYYNEDWELRPENENTYLLTLTLSGSSYEEHLQEGEIQVSEDKDLLCTLKVSCYIPIEVETGE